jgi:hypothetical protein
MDAPMKVRSDFVTFSRADRMALSTARLEKLSTSLRVTLYVVYENMFPRARITHITYRERKALLLDDVTEKGK